MTSRAIIIVMIVVIVNRVMSTVTVMTSGDAMSISWGKVQSKRFLFISFCIEIGMQGCTKIA